MILHVIYFPAITPDTAFKTDIVVHIFLLPTENRDPVSGMKHEKNAKWTKNDEYNMMKF